jgi:hypothetical protein
MTPAECLCRPRPCRCRLPNGIQSKTQPHASHGVEACQQMAAPDPLATNTQ